MVLQLHILGPAFGLPSIDAECIAAIALLRLLYGCDASIWSLLVCHTHSEGLPLLVDGETRHHGFDSIAQHLHTNHNHIKSRNVDRADEIAIASLIQSRAPLLISAYLYVSSENWTRVTRGALSPILSPFARFWLPSVLRSAAKSSIAHLGISTVEVDSPHDDRRLEGVDSSFEAASRHRASLILPSKTTVQDLLAKKEGAATFKLYALADSLFAPLQAMLGDKRWLSPGDEPQQLDCLAYGYLSIMSQAVLPSKWLSTILGERYTKLDSYTKRLGNVLGLQTVLSDLKRNERPRCTSPDTPGADSMILPWSTSDSASQITTMSVRQLLEYAIPAVQRSPVFSEDDSSADYSTASAIAVAGLAALGGIVYAIRPLISLKHGQPVQIFGQKPAPSFEHLAQALAGLTMDFSSPRLADPLDITPEHAEAPVTEVSIEA